MPELQEQLQAIGLSEHEALVLSVLLPHSPSSASFIAKKANLSRSSVYTLLSALTVKGLVSTTYKNEVKQFVAEDYESMKQFLDTEQHRLKQRFQALEKIEKTFATVSQAPKHIPNISFFEGQEGLKKIYLTMIRNARKGDTFYILRDEFIWKDDWQFVFEEEWSDRVTRIKKEKNIKTKLLVNDSATEKNVTKLYKQKPGLRYRFLPKKYAVKDFALYIMGDMAATMSMEEYNLVGTLVINENVAHNQRQLFLGLWDSIKN